MADYSTEIMKFQPSLDESASMKTDGVTDSNKSQDPVVADEAAHTLLSPGHPNDRDPATGKTADDAESGVFDGGSGSDSSDWDAPDFAEHEGGDQTWCELTLVEKVKKVAGCVGKPLAVLVLLYFFICSLGLLSSAFQILGGKAAGKAFSNSALLSNPVAGLMIGILATVLVQSSSTSTSIVVTLVSCSIMDVQQAIPVVMGANIGTSVTNTIVSMMQSSDSTQFKRAFAGATVHDMFNWLSVFVFLPLEVVSSYLFHLTSWMVEGMDWSRGSGSNQQLLSVITKPLTKSIVMIDKKVIQKSALGELHEGCNFILKKYCGTEDMYVPPEDVELYINRTIAMEMCSGGAANKTFDPADHYTLVNSTQGLMAVVQQPIPCSYLMYNLIHYETLAGLLLMTCSLFLLCFCLVLIVKILNSSLKGQLAKAVFKLLNMNFPGRLSFLTGYLAIIAGAILTMLVQSSSIFTSTLTPLVGVGVITLDRMYPLTLGSNIGTTTTGLLAAMAATGTQQQSALQIALCHMFFNISGILLFYPIPKTRIPIRLAKGLGTTTAKYRWFAVLYLILMFIVLPGSVFALSMAGPIAMGVVGGAILLLLVASLIFCLLKRKGPEKLRKKLDHFYQTRIPKPLRSLEPYDKIIRKVQGSIFLLGMMSHYKKKSNTTKNYDPKSRKNIPHIQIDIEKENPDHSNSHPIYTGCKSYKEIFPQSLCAGLPQTSLVGPDSTLLAEKLMETDTDLSFDTESGYGSKWPTPGATPAPSKFPSLEHL